MSIKSETFKLVKEVWKFDYIEEYRKFMNELRYEKGDAANYPEAKKTNYGYVARQQNLQAWGYILPELNREKINEDKFMKIPALKQEELELLEKPHLFIYEFNRICVNRLFKDYNNIRKSLILYNHKQYNYKFSIDKYFENSMFDNLISEIEKSKSYNLIRQNRTMLNKIDTSHIVGFNDFLEKKIESTGISLISTDLRDIFHGNVPNGIESKHYKAMFSLFVFERQIFNICQLIFQGFLMDKLKCFDEDDIYQVNHSGSNMIGKFIDINVQGFELLPFLSVRDIVMINLEDGYNINTLASIHSKEMSMDKLSGDTEHYQMRLLDDDLNMYQYLLDSVGRR